MADKEKWITLKSGKRVKLDKDGTVIAGFPGFTGKNVSDLGDTTEIKKYSPPSKTLSSFISENSDPTKGAEEYFKQNLQNTYVKTNVNGKDIDVHFTKNTAHKLRDNLHDNPQLAYFVDVFPSVLEQYDSCKGNTKPRTDYNGFYYFKKKVTKSIPQKVNGKIANKKVTMTVRLDVGIRKNNIDFFESYSSAEDKKKVILSDISNVNGGKATPPHCRTKNITFDEKNIYDKGEIVNIEIDILEDEPMNNKKTVIFDSKSKRSFDINGFMHVELSNLTKESVDPYYGYEIVNSEALGFEPDKIYFGYRKGEELDKAASSFNGLPLMREHHFDSAEKPQREHRVGSVGTNCVYNAPYLQASLTITDGEAIRKIESGERMELSCSYFYKAIVEKGEFNGQPYDFIMTDIQGNHVALVEEGRAGADVRVADSGENVKNIQQNQENIQPLTQKENTMPETTEEKKEPIQDEETKEKTCDSELSEEKKEVPPAAEDDEPEIEETLRSLGVEISDDVKHAFLAGMHFAHKNDEENAALDNELSGESKESVQDAETESPAAKEAPLAAPKAAMDANTIKRQIREEMRGVQLAVRDVRPLVGELDVVAFDSASGVYLKACELLGFSATKNTARDVCRALLATGNGKPQMVSDSASHDFQSRFADE